MTDTVDSYLAHLGLEVGDELKHYGKKGMKWGVRNDDSGGSSGPSRVERKAAKKAAKEAANQEIIDARVRQAERANDLEKQAFRTYSANGEKAAKAALNKYARMEVELLTNPDAATSQKMTSGEKIANGVNWAVLGTLTAAAVALSIASDR
jgi:hypothetical protein